MGDLVQLLFNSGGERVIDERREVINHQAYNGERGPRRNKRLALFPYVTAVDNRAENRGVCGWPTDAQFFESLDESRLGESTWWRSIVADRVDRFNCDRVANFKKRKQRLLFGLGVFFNFLIRLAVSGERNCCTARRELAVGYWGRLSVAADAHRHRRAVGVRHLRRQGALPDQSVQR